MWLHYPKPDMTDKIIAAMKKYKMAMDGKDGHRETHLLRDTKTGKLIGMAFWDSKAQWKEVYQEIEAAVNNEPFYEWEDMPPKVYHLEEV
jgi:heme-degrading monooxygenase HmoA